MAPVVDASEPETILQALSLDPDWTELPQELLYRILHLAVGSLARTVCTEVTLGLEPSTASLATLQQCLSCHASLHRPCHLCRTLS